MLKDGTNRMSDGKKYLLTVSLLINLALLVTLIVNLASYHLTGKELDTLTSRCYESGGSVKMDVEDLAAGKYDFQCIKK
ncbi:hypothetical protein [Bacillus salacetis]|nr:hypothetical protein [Bacillus salacetis]